MTRKETLSVLYRFWDVHWRPTYYQQPEHEVERREIENTTHHAIHGEAPLHGSSWLCDVCHLRYADGFLYEDIGGLCEPCRAARAAQPLPVSQELPV